MLFKSKFVTKFHQVFVTSCISSLAEGMLRIMIGFCQLLVFGALRIAILVNLPFLFLVWCKNFHKPINNHSDYFLSVIIIDFNRGILTEFFCNNLTNHLNLTINEIEP